MLSVAATVWNQVAQQGLRTPWARRMFRMDQEALTEAHEAQAEALEAQGVDPQVALAYLDVAPLVLEKEAISRLREARPMLASTLPEANSADEAAALAIRDRALSGQQANALRTLLNSAPPSS